LHSGIQGEIYIIFKPCVFVVLGSCKLQLMMMDKLKLVCSII